ncbi:hypothetical protein AVEN_112408-1 [Araneus ventricosus]|uniref:Uncharacterized protein n=1 Tax=Araneus ventricosus TaxID=182803 RepID=A0A4Y2PAT6_ARAVE|nr:hypothetical protein AVEN_112408-1 [Araneus ventricosus]
MVWDLWSLKIPTRPDPSRTRRKREEKGSRDVVKTTLYYITRRGLKGPCRVTVERSPEVTVKKNSLRLSNDEAGRGAHVCGWLKCSSPGQIMEIKPFGHASEGMVKGIFKLEFGRREEDSETRLETGD